MPEDAANFEAMTKWVAVAKCPGDLVGVAVALDGPFEALGMDPVYLLRLDSACGEAEASLFRGGTQLMVHVDKVSLEVWQGHVDAATPTEITAALTALANRL